jgi:hypothetical protein
MATMYPEQIGGLDRATEGELKVFHFLREAARPHNDYQCWYAPILGGEGMEPDFVLFGKDLGLLVLEVKDWVLPQIVAADPHQFIVRARGEVVTKTNPDRQARQYVNLLMERLKGNPTFLEQRPPHFGQLKVPVGRMVVFPNIARQDYLESGLDKIIPLERVLVDEDINPAGDLFSDSSGRTFRERIAGAFPFRFVGITPKEIEKIQAVIWPVVRLDLPVRQGLGKAHFQAEVRALDDLQARVARRLGRGHRILKGPPGSGKTLVLVHRCYLLHKYHPKIKRILLICYNIVFVSYLKRLLQEKGLGIGEGGIWVYHFFELCSHILKDSLGEPVKYDVPDSSYYELVVQYALDAVQSNQHDLGKFDAILVDEGQDFSNDMLKILLGLLRPGGDLIIALDSYQDLYRRETSWRTLGIQAQGRSTYLGRVYRNTEEIFEFTQRFLGEKFRGAPQAALFPDYVSYHGDPPEMRRFGNSEEIERFLTEDIRKQITRGEYRCSEIAIIYDDKVYEAEGFRYDDRNLPRRLLQRLEGAGIPTKWVSQDLRAKEMFDITTDRVSLVSIHSAKGLDFDLVYLVGADRMLPTEETRPHLTRLLYVAMTRAKHHLVILYIEETKFIQQMCECLSL